MTQQKGDVGQGSHESEQPTEHAAKIASGFTIEMPVVGVATAGAWQHGAEFPEGKRASEGEQAAREPNQQHQPIIAQLMSKAAGGSKDTRADHGGHHRSGGGPKPKWAVGGIFAHFWLAK